METRDIEFKFKGARDYIHGTDMFNVMMGAVDNLQVPHTIRFVIHDFVRNPKCQLYLADSREELSKLKDIRVHCQYIVNDYMYLFALKENAKNNNVSGKRREYDEELIISLCRLDGDRIVFNNRSPFSFIESIVSMSKYMHQKLFPNIDGQWIFSRIDLNSFSDEREDLSLQLRHNMNHRLTKSDILVGGGKIGDLYFSLVKA